MCSMLNWACLCYALFYFNSGMFQTRWIMQMLICAPDQCNSGSHFTIIKMQGIKQ